MGKITRLTSLKRRHLPFLRYLENAKKSLAFHRGMAFTQSKKDIAFEIKKTRIAYFKHDRSQKQMSIFLCIKPSHFDYAFVRHLAFLFARTTAYFSCVFGSAASQKLNYLQKS
ncbi:hypothetical protein [Undibacterium sp. Ren11W]|uniref:hypothetical protein n=1 Tax=Undibacterium sp. Ren11W TaxID=3413045 RepID=UPI003BF34285